MTCCIELDTAEWVKSVQRSIGDFNRRVAIKRLKEELAQRSHSLQRFLAEARAVAALNHYNIVQIYDFGRDKEGFLNRSALNCAISNS
jgi:serine/threonine-protein kinase